MLVRVYCRSFAFNHYHTLTVQCWVYNKESTVFYRSCPVCRCLHVCMHVCLFVYMYVCVNVCIHAYVSNLRMLGWDSLFMSCTSRSMLARLLLSLFIFRAITWSEAL